MQPHVYFVQPKLPEQLRPLQTLAWNLYWNKDLEINTLFRHLDPVLWETSGQNPLSMLYFLQEQQLVNAANDLEYIGLVNRIWNEYQTYQEMHSTWSQNQHLDSKRVIAFFSAEFGITEILPIYAGGLGLLAGDYLKSASDLGLSLVGVSLLYKKGYFHQKIDPNGWQKEVYHQYDLSKFPLELVRKEDGSPKTIEIELPDRVVQIQIWRAVVGRINLYLLDTDCSSNREEDRSISDRLYGGDIEKRILQEIVLGVGGMRALIAMGIEPGSMSFERRSFGFLSFGTDSLSGAKMRLEFFGSLVIGLFQQCFYYSHSG